MNTEIKIRETHMGQQFITGETSISAAAAALGRLGGMKGGKSKSAAKIAAVRENGRKGGRPKGSKNKAKAKMV